MSDHETETPHQDEESTLKREAFDNVIKLVPKQPEEMSEAWFRKHSPMTPRPPLEPLPFLTSSQRRRLGKTDPRRVWDYDCSRALLAQGIPELAIQNALTLAKQMDWPLADVVVKALMFFDGNFGDFPDELKA